MLQIDAAQLAACLERGALVDALEGAFRAPAVVPDREHYEVAGSQAAGGTLLLMPAWRVGGALGIKIATVFPDNARLGLPAVGATYLLLDAATGMPRALIDGVELTLRRTGAASALASRHLSGAHASRLLMVGTGKLAPHLIESHAAVRPIREVRVWGRSPERARAVAASLSHAAFTVQATGDLEAAVRWADIVSCATLSRRPLVRGAWLEPGQHLDLVGAFNKDMCEADDEAIGKAEIFVDTRAGALAEAGEITGAMARGVIDATAIRAELFELSSGRFARSSPNAITVFKSVGTALEDLAAAELAVASTEVPPGS
jgi:ornithine cyclodeaminase/alanine dehydrogenase-like protein (mu-crystallin family)